MRLRSKPADVQVSAATLKLRMLKKLKCTMRHEKAVWAGGAQFVAGVDEVGRGCLFGPVVAAAVILNPNRLIRGLRDSKLLPEKKREELNSRIREHALAFAIASVDAWRIDEINIYQAARQAMREAVLQLTMQPGHLLVDAMRIDLQYAQTSIIHGDALSASIAAASIIAKVERDRMVRELDAVYPLYGLASHKGYSTPRHIAALREHGPCPLHRKTFAPVWLAEHPQELLELVMNDGVVSDEVINGAATNDGVINVQVMN